MAGNGGIIGPTQTVEITAATSTTFNSSGTLTTQSTTTAVNVLVIAGGGAGTRDRGGGGGAGGYRFCTSIPVSGSSPYAVVVGAAGAADSSSGNRGSCGSNSSFAPGTPIEFTSTGGCLLYTSPSPRDGLLSRMPSSA